MDEVLCTRTGGVLRITLNRPDRLNALTSSMVRTLTSVLELATQEYGETRVLVIRGSGRGFCAGADTSALDWLTAPTTSDEARVAEVSAAGAVILALRHFPGPTIAEVNGAAAGGGCNLAIACDFVFAAQTARLGQMFVKRDLALDMGGAWLLPRFVGFRRAAELAFCGDLLEARQALAIGLITGVLQDDELANYVERFAASLAGRSAGVLASIKSQLAYGCAHDLAESLAFESNVQADRLRLLASQRADGEQS